MEIKTVGFCPLGKTCLEIKDNTIHRCHWYITISGQHPQTGEKIQDESKCALVWMPILTLETNKDVRSVQEATESFRNEMIKSNNELISCVNPLNNVLLIKNQ